MMLAILSLSWMSQMSSGKWLTGKNNNSINKPWLLSKKIWCLTVYWSDLRLLLIFASVFLFMWGLDRFTDGLGTSAVVLVAALGGFNSIYNCSLTEDPCAVYFYGESGRVVDFSSLMHRSGNMHLSILFVCISHPM
jgi:hypothetical protein